MNGRPSIHVHPCNSIRSSTASGSKRSTMTMGAPRFTEIRSVKRPVPWTIGHALSTVCAASRLGCVDKVANPQADRGYHDEAEETIGGLVVTGRQPAAMFKF